MEAHQIADLIRQEIMRQANYSAKLFAQRIDSPDVMLIIGELDLFAIAKVLEKI